MNLTDAVADFLTFAEMLTEANLTDAHEVLAAFAAWCARTPIDGIVDDYDDAVMIQWGAMRFLDVGAPQDTRGWPDDQLNYSETREHYIDITRQINPGDFDMDAAGLTLQLSFGENHGERPPSGNAYLPGSTRLADHIVGATDDPNAQALLATPMVRLQAMVGYIG